MVTDLTQREWRIGRVSAALRVEKLAENSVDRDIIIVDSFAGIRPVGGFARRPRLRGLIGSGWFDLQYGGGVK